MKPAAPLPALRRRLLILRGGAVGDFILTGPVFDTLRTHAPRAIIELAGYPRIAELASRAGWIDAFRSLDHPAAARLFSRHDTPPDLSDWGAAPPCYDGVLSFLHDPDRLVTDNWRRAGGCPVTVHPPLPHTRQAAADHLRAALNDWGIATPPGAYPVMRLSALSAADPRETSHPPVALHPGSGGAAKRWPLEHFLTLARQLRNAWTPCWIFGEAERDLQMRFESLAGHEFPVWKDLSLSDLADRLVTCRGFVGNDAGVTHLAAALGVPTVALFGPSDPVVWAPRNPNALVMTAASRSSVALAAMSPYAVEQVCRKQFAACNPVPVLSERTEDQA
jgi:heptosyltransferase III